MNFSMWNYTISPSAKLVGICPLSKMQFYITQHLSPLLIIQVEITKTAINKRFILVLQPEMIFALHWQVVNVYFSPSPSGCLETYSPISHKVLQSPINSGENNRGMEHTHKSLLAEMNHQSSVSLTTNSVSLRIRMDLCIISTS